MWCSLKEYQFHRDATASNYHVAPSLKFKEQILYIALVFLLPWSIFQIVTFLEITDIFINSKYLSDFHMAERSEKFQEFKSSAT